METPTKKTQLTELLANDTLGRVEKMRLLSRRKFTNKSHGEHLSGKGGTSTEFSDYRNYVAGDDVRYVDWNIFSRLGRPYMKQYRHEEEMHVVIIVDASSSMMFENKFTLAKQLATALGIMSIMSLERLSIYGCHMQGLHPFQLPPCSGRTSLKRLLAFMEGLEGGGDQPIDQAVESVLRTHRGRGICVLLSDFLTLGDLSKSFNMLYSRGLEVMGLQVLGPSEIHPDLTGDIRLVDSEYGSTLDISSAGDLLELYQEHRLALEEQLALQCRQRSGRFLSINSETTVEQILFDLLRREGWVQ
ncbi:hypothetical protein Pla110_04920 [Polystyrenella longa]|uniref:DUF58 domain-containing protein n=1 Tax=Polystyrenella longa TaxID=2528007 RepID=A0A518CHS5_9PLAN|nr:DUF58 domain-containing protein [Polystyrenella longa]QDU78788.1 hypothetical protein Pla110_04920 [Polystyrenella longa]